MGHRTQYFREYYRRNREFRRDRDNAYDAQRRWVRWLLRELGVSPVEKRAAIRYTPDPESAIWPNPALDADLERRILSADGMRVDLATGCWLTPGDPLKYGGVKVNGSTINASRASWICFHGAVPEGMYVCHKCDNRRCRNPGHLFVATQRENMRDATKKGRVAGGAAAAGAWGDKRVVVYQGAGRALTNEQVAEIRSSGKSDYHWARKLGVWKATIRNARLGVTYAEVDVAPDTAPRKPQSAATVTIQRAPKRAAVDRATYARELWRKHAHAFNEARNRRKWARWLVKETLTELAFSESLATEARR